MRRLTLAFAGRIHSSDGGKDSDLNLDFKPVGCLLKAFAHMRSVPNFQVLVHCLVVGVMSAL